MPQLLHQFDVLSILATNPQFVTQVDVLRTINPNSEAFIQQSIDTVVAATNSRIFVELMAYVIFPLLFAVIALFYCCCAMPCCVCCSSQYQFEKQAAELLLQAKQYGITNDMDEDDELTIKQKKYFRMQHQNEELRAKAKKYNYYFAIAYALWFLSALVMIAFLSSFQLRFQRIFKQNTVQAITSAGQDLSTYSFKLFKPADEFLQKACGFSDVSLNSMYSNDTQAYSALVQAFQHAPANVQFVNELIDGIILDKTGSAVLQVMNTASSKSSFSTTSVEIQEAYQQLADFMFAIQPFLTAFEAKQPLIEKLGGGQLSWPEAIFRTLCEFGMLEVDCSTIDDAFLTNDDNALGMFTKLYRKYYPDLRALLQSKTIDQLIPALQSIFGVTLPFTSEEGLKTYLDTLIASANAPFASFAQLLSRQTTHAFLQLLPNLNLVTWDVITQFCDGECVQVAPSGNTLNCAINSPESVVNFSELLPKDLYQIVGQSPEILGALSQLKLTLFNISERMNHVDIGLDTRSFKVIINAFSQRVNSVYMKSFSVSKLWNLMRYAGVIALIGGTTILLIQACGCMVCRNPFFSRCSLGCTGISQLARALCTLMCALLAVLCMFAASVPHVLGQLDMTATAFFEAPEYSIQRAEWAKQVQAKLDVHTNSFFAKLGFQVQDPELYAENNGVNSAQYEISSAFGVKIRRAVVDFSSKSAFFENAVIKIAYSMQDFKAVSEVLQYPGQLRQDARYILCSAFYARLPSGSRPVDCGDPGTFVFAYTPQIVDFLKAFPAALQPKVSAYVSLLENLQTIFGSLESYASSMLQKSFELEIGVCDDAFEVFQSRRPFLDIFYIQYSAEQAPARRYRPSELLSELSRVVSTEFGVFGAFDARLRDRLSELSGAQSYNFSPLELVFAGLLSNFEDAVLSAPNVEFPYAKTDLVQWLQGALSDFVIGDLTSIFEGFANAFDAENAFSADIAVLALNDEISGLLDAAHFSCAADSAGVDLHVVCRGVEALSGPTNAYRAIPAADHTRRADFWLSGAVKLSRGVSNDFTLKNTVFSDQNILSRRFGLTSQQITAMGSAATQLCLQYRAAITKLLNLAKVAKIAQPDLIQPLLAGVWRFEAVRLVPTSESPFFAYIGGFAQNTAQMAYFLQTYTENVAKTAIVSASTFFTPGSRWTIGEFGENFAVSTSALAQTLVSDLLGSQVLTVPALRVREIADPYADVFAAMHYYYFCVWAMAIVQPILAAIAWPFMSAHAYDKHERARIAKAEMRAARKRQQIEERNKKIINDLEAEGGGVIFVKDQDELDKILAEQDAVDFQGEYIDPNADDAPDAPDVQLSSPEAQIGVAVTDTSVACTEHETQ